MASDYDALRFADRMVEQVRLMTDALRDFIDELEESAGNDAVVADTEGWKSFLDGHPELERKPFSFTDAELLRALREAIRAWDRRMPKERRGHGVWSSNVADVLAGVAVMPGKGRCPKELLPTNGDVAKVGRALSRLARDGRVERTNRRWEMNRWAPAKRGGRDAS